MTVTADRDPTHLLEDPRQLLQEWYDDWCENPYSRVKMPNSLHVRTAVYLQVSSLLDAVVEHTPLAAQLPAPSETAANE